jgi:thiamine-phosphate pyrophosphorylase
MLPLSRAPLFSPQCLKPLLARQYSRRFDLSLYLVTERACVKSEEEFLHKARRAVQGGATCLQLRDRFEDTSTSIRTARSLKELGVTVIVNNRIDVALAANADGVHLGRTDFPYSEARELLGPKPIIGITVYCLDDVHEAESLDIDYLGVQIFPSKHTKPESTTAWDLKGLEKIKKISRHRIAAIGGIDPGDDHIKTICSILDIGNDQDGIAMVGPLWRSDDPFIVAQKIRRDFVSYSMQNKSRGDV